MLLVKRPLSLHTGLLGNDTLCYKMCENSIKHLKIYRSRSALLISFPSKINLVRKFLGVFFLSIFHHVRSTLEHWSFSSQSSTRCTNAKVCKWPVKVHRKLHRKHEPGLQFGIPVSSSLKFLSHTENAATKLLSGTKCGVCVTLILTTQVAN